MTSSCHEAMSFNLLVNMSDTGMNATASMFWATTPSSKLTSPWADACHMHSQHRAIHKGLQPERRVRNSNMGSVKWLVWASTILQ